MSGRLIKRLISGALALTLVFSINGFAAVVTDTDGSAFITKAEFDSLKNSFQAQIDSYNQVIDSKIDGAIASYLAGVKISVEIPYTPLYKTNKLNFLGGNRITEVPMIEFNCDMVAIGYWDTTYNVTTGTAAWNGRLTGNFSNAASLKHTHLIGERVGDKFILQNYNKVQSLSGSFAKIKSVNSRTDKNNYIAMNPAGGTAFVILRDGVLDKSNTVKPGQLWIDGAQEMVSCGWNSGSLDNLGIRLWARSVEATGPINPAFIKGDFPYTTQMLYNKNASGNLLVDDNNNFNFTGWDTKSWKSTDSADDYYIPLAQQSNTKCFCIDFKDGGLRWYFGAISDDIKNRTHSFDAAMQLWTNEINGSNVYTRTRAVTLKGNAIQVPDWELLHRQNSASDAGTVGDYFNYNGDFWGAPDSGYIVASDIMQDLDDQEEINIAAGWKLTNAAETDKLSLRVHIDCDNAGSVKVAASKTAFTDGLSNISYYKINGTSGPLTIANGSNTLVLEVDRGDPCFIKFISSDDKDVTVELLDGRWTDTN